MTAPAPIGCQGRPITRASSCSRLSCWVLAPELGQTNLPWCNRSAATQLGLCVGTRHDACRWSAGSSHLQAGGEDEPERVYRRVAHFVDCFLCLWFGPVRQTQCGSSIGAGSGYMDRAGPASEGDAISLGDRTFGKPATAIQR